MKISARNQLKGKVVEVTKGATTAHVKLDIGGSIVTASITNQAVDELQLEVGLCRGQSFGRHDCGRLTSPISKSPFWATR